MSSEARPLERHDPAKYVRTLRYRERDKLPFDVGAISAGAILMLDATVYIDAQKAKLPSDLRALIAGAEIRHSAVALGEIAANLGALDPAHPGTAAIISALRETLARAEPERTVSPSSDAWIEGSVIAGILARIQGFPQPARRKLLNDALIFLSAAEADAVLVSRNIKDMDLLLQLKPDVRVLLYDQAS